MVRIVSDTSTLYSTQQAKDAGFAVSPLSVTIAGKTYREFDEISSAEFVSIIRQGHMPTSSQPAIGEVMAMYEQFPEDEILNVAMADGLSGTYNSAAAAAGMCAGGERITVLNTRTLCGPHRYLVEKAVELAKAGRSVKEIVAALEEKMAAAKSYLIPDDFDYLRRGGRLSPMVSYVGKTIHLTPVMTQTEDGCRIVVAVIRRGFANAVKYVGEALKRREVGKGWRVYISHADVREKAEQMRDYLREQLPGAILEIYPLSPAFITQGGPGCVAVQVIEE